MEKRTNAVDGHGHFRLHGVVPPIATPLCAGDRVDEPALRRLTRYLLSAGVNGILVNGTMGGFAYLPDQEQFRAASIVVEETAGAIPVIGCVGEGGTVRAVHKVKEMERLGVSYVSALPPTYFFTTQEHLLRFYSDVAAATSLPLLLYDNPVMTKNAIHPETVAELRRRIPSLVGIKESNQDCVNLQLLLSLMRNDENFSVFTGSEFLIVVALQMGCRGLVGGLHNLCPHLAVRLYRSFCDGDLESARQSQRDLIDAWGVFKYGHIWGGFDESLRYLELADRATGEPYAGYVTPVEAAAIHKLMDRHAKRYSGSESTVETTSRD